ncbi:MAG: DUF438 domain-containing protein [candidate division WOR-3 bacterium]
MDPEIAKEKFRGILKDLSVEEITSIEEELIKEGISLEEIQRLCDIHLKIFKEYLDKQNILVPEGHPIQILMEEHKIILRFVEDLKNIIERANNVKDHRLLNKEFHNIVEHFKDSEKHYLREENVLFPYIEKHGITEPPKVMWAEHNEIRVNEKELYSIIEEEKKIKQEDYIKKLKDITFALGDKLMSHFYKENNILFPTALNIIKEDEWKDIETQFTEIGYCCFTPKIINIPTEKVEAKKLTKGSEKLIEFETGSFSLEELESVLNTLPIDITFVDKNDTVRYFNQAKERIFPRGKAVIGRKVQLCHPPQSLHKVEEILRDFKNNKRDVAEFWINMRGRLIHIRYFAVRRNEKYLGTLEVTHDITEIKNIEGEKRLL